MRIVFRPTRNETAVKPDGGMDWSAVDSVTMVVTGTPAHVWNNLESAYQGHRARQAETERLQADEARLDTFPVKELIKRGCIQKWNNRTEPETF